MSAMKPAALPPASDLDAAPENEAALTDILGLSPPASDSNRSVKTYQCGEFKYPDVSSPLKRILSDRRGSLNDERARSIRRRSSLLEAGSRLLVEPSSFDDVFLIRQGGPPRPPPSPYGQRRYSYSQAAAAAAAGSSPESAADSAYSGSARGSSSAAETTATYSTSSTSESGGGGVMNGGGIGASINGPPGHGGGPSGTVDMDVLSELLRSLSMQHEGSNSVGPADGGGGELPKDPIYSSGGGGGSGYCPMPPEPSSSNGGGGRISYEAAFPSPAVGSGTVPISSTEGRKIWQDIQDFVHHNPHLTSNRFNTPSPSLSPDEAMALAGFDCSPSGATDAISLEKAARIHRNSAALNDAACTWSGQLPVRNHGKTALSCKVFLGGVPWDITEPGLVAAFKPFGNVKVEWPGKESSSIPKGYLYVVFEQEKQVKMLLSACTHDFGGGGSFYYKVSSRRMRNKEVQVIPWFLADSGFVRSQSQRLDPQKTVFVGALHGMLNAEGLCVIFNDLFGGVVYAGIDTDKYKYPIGSARVTFNNYRSYMKAVSAAFIEIKTPKFTKKVQVDPYLEDALCTSCQIRQGPYFCRDPACFRYFCRSCWETAHELLCHHKPLMRNCKHNATATTTNNNTNNYHAAANSRAANIGLTYQQQMMVYQ